MIDEENKVCELVVVKKKSSMLYLWRPLLFYFSLFWSHLKLLQQSFKLF